MIIYKKYVFNNFSEKYKKYFINEKYKIGNILPKAKIEHVGSSSVRGLGGKSIIDIAISVPKKEIDYSRKILQKKGYVYRPIAGDKDRTFLERKIEYAGKESWVHIQLTYTNSKIWKSMIAVREYLKQHREIIKEYEQIKKEAVNNAKGEGKIYREYKRQFLNRIEKEALKYHKLHNCCLLRPFHQ